MDDLKKKELLYPNLKESEKNNIRWNTGNIADALDSLGVFGTIPSRLRRVSGHSKLIIGEAYTVRWAPTRKSGNIKQKQPSTWEQVRSFLVPELSGAHGKVYVAGAGEFVEEAALAGGLSATYFQEIGFEGIVLGGAMRDSEQLLNLSIPVVCSGFCPTDTQGGYRVVETGTFCVLGSLVVNTGDWIVSDGTGTVIIPKLIKKDVFDLVKQIEQRESSIFNQIKSNVPLATLIDEIGWI